MYNAVRRSVHEKLCSILSLDAVRISITADSWMSRASDNYASMTCDILSDCFVPRSCVLTCRQLRANHAENLQRTCNAENLHCLVMDILKQRDIPEKLPCYIVTDNAQSLVSPTGPTLWLHFACCAQALQLYVQGMKKTSNRFSSMRASAQVIVGLYK